MSLPSPTRHSRVTAGEAACSRSRGRSCCRGSARPWRRPRDAIPLVARHPDAVGEHGRALAHEPVPFVHRQGSPRRRGRRPRGCDSRRGSRRCGSGSTARAAPRALRAAAASGAVHSSSAKRGTIATRRRPPSRRATSTRRSHAVERRGVSSSTSPGAPRSINVGRHAPGARAVELRRTTVRRAGMAGAVDRRARRPCAIGASRTLGPLAAGVRALGEARLFGEDERRATRATGRSRCRSPASAAGSQYARPRSREARRPARSRRPRNPPARDPRT